MSVMSLEDEIAEFDGLWDGGYFEGDPLDPLGRSGYRKYGYISILHATYLRCIKPYVNAGTVALEIGPGRGGWTKALLPAREVWALDALSAEHNGFFEYVGRHDHVKYLQVTDFECRDLSERHFDYMFSFGCLCHVSFEGIAAYARNLFPKLVAGANCFWMVADKSKFLRFLGERERFDIWKGIAPKRNFLKPVESLLRAGSAFNTPDFEGSDPFNEARCRWQDAGLERTCELLETIGYKVMDPDVGTIPRDPIIHFVKP